MEFGLYNCEARQVDGTLDKIEPCLAASLYSNGLYMVRVVIDPNDSVEDCKFDEKSLLNTYVPEDKTVGMVTQSYKYGWIYNMYHKYDHIISAGSAHDGILKEALDYAVANNVTIIVTISPIE